METSTSTVPAPTPGRLSRTDALELAILALVIVLVRGLPRWVLGQDSHVTIHDNLDSDFLYRVLINQPGRLFDYAGTIPEMLGGVPRWTFPSGLKFSSLVFHFLEPFPAYCLLEQTVSLGGAAGLWLLLRDYVPSLRFYRAGVVLCFGLLPFLPIYDSSVAGQPLVLWALLNAWFGRKRLVSLTICGAFSFFSVLQMSGIFVVAAAAIGVAMAALWHARTRGWRTLVWPAACVAALGGGYLVTDYGFLSHYLLDDFVSHREGYAIVRSDGVLRTKKVLALLMFGRYHAASHHAGIAVLALITALVSFWRGQRHRALRIVALLLLAVVVAFTSQLFRWPGLAVLARAFPTLAQITPRFWWSFPLLWYLIWGCAIAAWPRTRWAQLSFAAFLAFQLPLSTFGAQQELNKNYNLLAARIQGVHPPRTIPTYRAFLSQSAVHELRDYVGDRPGRYLCLGFHPSVLQFQGLQTVDGYRDLYPLAYKVAFRKLMADDLARDKALARYFEEFGGRVYYFYPKAPHTAFSKDPFARPSPQRVRMNREVALELGVRWVVSTFRIQGPAKRHLTYQRQFSQKGGFSFYLYSLE